MLVQRLLEASAARLGDKVAIVAGQRRVTYAELDRAANRLAQALQQAGVSRGDRVLILLDSTIEAVIAIFGVLKAGSVYIMLHPGTRSERLAYTVESTRPTALITDGLRAQSFHDVVSRAASLKCLVWANAALSEVASQARQIAWADLSEYSTDRPACVCIDVDLAMIIYTSGSTGEPKGVMASHANMLAATSSINESLDTRENDVILNVLPLAHGYGMFQVLQAFQVGARVILEPGFAFPARIVDLLHKERVTVLPGVPTFFALLLRHPKLFNKPLADLRYITNAAAALPTPHIQQLRQVFPNARIVSMYGQTEALPRIAFLPSEQLDRRPDSVGIGIPNTEVFLVDETGQRVPPGQTGELVVRGSNIARGYWQAPALSADKFRSGAIPGETVLYTGDLFRMDEEGFLYFVARRDDIINTRGEKVSPREVENIVCRMAGVAEAAAVGVQDEIFGQAVLLVVAAQPGVTLTEQAVRAFCAQTLDDYMQPKYVDLVAELPRNDNGKVDKRRILAEFTVTS